MLGLEHLVHRTVPLPQQNTRLLDLLDRQSTHWLVEIPHQHFIGLDAVHIAAPAAQVLVRKEQHFFAAAHCPVEYQLGVTRCANDAAMLAAERLQIGCGIDIGDRRHMLVGIEHRGNLAPDTLNLGEARHIGHRTARTHVGQYCRLLGTGQNIGYFGHEMHAAEYDVLGIRLCRQL